MSEEIVDDRRELRADCARCAGLCCVAPAFSASSDFAVDKPAGTPCGNLQPDFRCGIHGELRERGFRGCTVFDCFGAGQKITQHTFGGQDWRSAPQLAGAMFTAFGVMRQLHELLWYLTEALTRPEARTVHDELRAALAATEQLTLEVPGKLVAVDVAAHREQVNVLLLRTSELVRAAAPQPQVDRRGADLIGRSFRGADLRGANLRGTYLIGADLRGADLAMADVIGADLRGADLRGARLAEALFLTRFQVDGANGDLDTTLPPPFTRPAHWALAVVPAPRREARRKRR